VLRSEKTNCPCVHSSSALQHWKFRGKRTVVKQKVGAKQAGPNFEGESATVNIPNDWA